MEISIIAAMAINRAIGFRNALPWHLPEDLYRFKTLTTGHTIVMGRKTFDSLPNGALPQRRNIVVSRSRATIDGCEVFASLEAALQACSEEHEVFVIGGETIYRQALPLAHRLYITLVDQEPEAADAFFPPIDMQRWRQIKKEKHHGFSFIEYISK